VKRIGPKTEPCGTPQDDSKMEEEVEPEVTKNDLLEIKDLSQLWEEPMMPKPEVRRLIRITWSMVSKAALRSRERSRVASPLSDAWLKMDIYTKNISFYLKSYEFEQFFKCDLEIFLFTRAFNCLQHFRLDQYTASHTMVYVTH